MKMGGTDSKAMESGYEEMMKELYDMAAAATINAYAPFSGFRVGAALLADSGKVYKGVNVENSSYGASICAERTALVKAVSEGERRFTAIAIAAVADGPVESLPCGICRQFMYEFSPEIYIITGTDRERLNVRSLKELLPLGFALDAAGR